MDGHNDFAHKSAVFAPTSIWVYLRYMVILAKNGRSPPPVGVRSESLFNCYLQIEF